MWRSKLCFVCSLPLVLVVVSPAGAQETINVHRNSSGDPADTDAVERVSIGTGGRWLAFASTASNLVPGDSLGHWDVFVRDALYGTTVLISKGADGFPANSQSQSPAISADGRYVVFTSFATNLVPDPLPAVPQVYRVDRDTDGNGVFDEPGGTSIILVSRNSLGAPANGQCTSYPGAVSDDGNEIAFDSWATNLDPMDTNGLGDVFVRIVGSGTTELMSKSATGVPGNDISSGAAISGDGWVVGFHSSATNLVALDTNGVDDVYVRDRFFSTTVRVSLATAGYESAAHACCAQLSEDGTLIAFAGSGLDPADGSPSQDVYVRDRLAATTSLESVASDGTQANSWSGFPDISADGLQVLFFSPGSNLVLDDFNGKADIFRRHRGTGETFRVSIASDGSEGDESPNVWSAISPDGQSAAFVSGATTLDPPDLNGAVVDVFRHGPGFPCAPFLAAPGIGPLDMDPVAFSVNGPVDPHTEGIRFPRGGPSVPQFPVQPGNPVGAAIRIGPVPPASGLDSANPGDIFDYAAAVVPNDAVLFQTPALPLPLPGPSAPDGSANQILEASSMGLASGPAVAVEDWVSPIYDRDNIDALSFGEDYFPETMTLGYAPGPYADTVLVGEGKWELRTSLFNEPIVVTSTPAVSFRFSVDPWAVGLPGTAVSTESGGSDISFAGDLGPWESYGTAAGDVFGTPGLTRVGGLTAGAGGNSLVHDNVPLGLAPAGGPLPPMEDDLDALECVGDNTIPFAFGNPTRAGDLHARVLETGAPDLPAPGVSIHEASACNLVFFSVTRNSPGLPGTAVRTEFILDGGAAGDIFVAVPDPTGAPGSGLNLLFIENKEIGLYSAEGGVSPVHPKDACDDLDGLLLWIDPEYRAFLVEKILDLVATKPWVDMGHGSLFGPGMKLSLVKAYGAPKGSIKVAFSVTTDSQGNPGTAVDFEAGPLDGLYSSASGDIFYAEPYGPGILPNWLWFEETDLGLDPGTWINGSSTDLADLADNLNALDSIGESPTTLGADSPDASGTLRLLSLSPNPMRSQTSIRFALEKPTDVVVTVHDALGRLVSTVERTHLEAGWHERTWRGETDYGSHASAGVYFVRLSASGEERVQKLVLFR